VLCVEGGWSMVLVLILVLVVTPVLCLQTVYGSTKFMT
jgi:hypothetical protein